MKEREKTLNFIFFSLTRISSDHAPKMLGWNVPADDLKQIPEHWLSYEEPEASLHYLLGILYIAFTVFSLVGNGLVIWIFSW